MHADLRLILLIIALLCFVMSAMGITTVKFDGYRFIAAGLAFATLAILVT